MSNIGIDTALLNYNNMKNINSLKNLTGDDKKLKEQTDAFEAVILKQILDISLKSENSLFPKDAGDKIYKSMYNEQMSKSLSGGFGFSELLFNHLKENNK